jgi:hypothetical protein
MNKDGLHIIVMDGRNGRRIALGERKRTVV